MRIDRYLVLLLCFLPVCSKASSLKWVPVDGAERGPAVVTKVLKDDPTTYQVKIAVNGVYDQLVTNGQGSFHLLSLGDNKTLLETGAPALPILSQLVAIPPGTKMVTSITEEVWVDIDMSVIYPAQPLRLETESPKEFVINKQYYRRPFLPTLISTNGEMRWRGIRNAGVFVCPFRYYPQTEKLSVLRSFVLKVDFIPYNRKQTAGIALQKTENKFGMFANSVFTEKSSKRNAAASEQYDYLIIVGSPTILNSSELREFRRWKALKGLKTKVVGINSIGNSSTAIKNHINQERNKNIQYVLLIGSPSTIETASVHKHASPSGYIYGDRWYGCQNEDKDTLVDIPIGRFPTDQLSEFRNMVKKTIRYEMGQNLSNKILLMAHYESDNYDQESFQNNCNSIFDSYHEYASFYKAYGAPSYFYGGTDATNADVVNFINQGMHIVNYRGHGSNSYWGGTSSGFPFWNDQDETFYYSEVDSLNSNTNAVFFSVACYTGNISAENNMLGAFMCPPNGAAAFVGATTTTEHYANNNYNRSLYKNLYNKKIHRLGDINMLAHNHAISVYSINPSYIDYAKDNANAYICGGDPTLEIWTDNPHPIPFGGIFSSGNSITINTGLNDSCYVYLSTPDGDFIDSICVTNQTCTFTKPAGKFYCSIYKHNYVPFVIYCDSESHFLQNMTVTDKRFYDNMPMSIGEEVTQQEDFGEVILERGSKVLIQKGNGKVLLDVGFICNYGAELIVK